MYFMDRFLGGSDCRSRISAQHTYVRTYIVPFPGRITVPGPGQVCISRASLLDTYCRSIYGCGTKNDKTIAIPTRLDYHQSIYNIIVYNKFCSFNGPITSSEYPMLDCYCTRQPTISQMRRCHRKSSIYGMCHSSQ